MSPDRQGFWTSVIAGITALSGLLGSLHPYLPERAASQLDPAFSCLRYYDDVADFVVEHPRASAGLRQLPSAERPTATERQCGTTEELIEMFSRGGATSPVPVPTTVP